MQVHWPKKRPNCNLYAAIDVNPTAVIQAKGGIGDVIWHLPFLRAIAAVSPSRKVTLLAPPSTFGKELLAVEPTVAETIYFEHGGSELMRGVNLIRLAALLRQRRFRTLWIFDRTIRPAIAGCLAGIPERIGLGLGPQRFFITNSGIADSHYYDHPIEWLRSLMEVMKVPLPTTEPALPVPAAALEAIGKKFCAYPRPWCVVGIGAKDPARDWPDAKWLEFLCGLRGLAAGTVFLIGGAANVPRAQRLIAETAGAAAVNACDLRLAEAIALLDCADLFVGTDSGPMNLAAGVGTPAFAMFSINPVLTYSKFIHAIVPVGGIAPDGMARIAPVAVLERIKPHLASRKPSK